MAAGRRKQSETSGCQTAARRGRSQTCWTGWPCLVGRSSSTASTDSAGRRPMGTRSWSRGTREVSSARTGAQRVCHAPPSSVRAPPHASPSRPQTFASVLGSSHTPAASFLSAASLAEVQPRQPKACSRGPLPEPMSKRIWMHTHQLQLLHSMSLLRKVSNHTFDDDNGADKCLSCGPSSAHY